MSEPLFSIVIACYNQEGFVREAVESALSQGFPDKEVIVVDDASKDATADVLRTFGDSITFAGLTVNGGAVAGRNHGATLAKGKYIVFLDGDDVLMPGALEVYARLITERSPKFLFGHSEKCYGKIPESTAANAPPEIQFVEYANFMAKDRPCVFNTSTLVVNRAEFWDVGGWSPGIFYQDMQDLVTKLGASGKMILLLSPDTVWYRMHTTNAVSKVAPFLDGIHVLLAKAKAGTYPGGREIWAERSSWFGGLIFYWAKTALGAGLYRDAFRLLAAGWWMVLLGIFRRITAVVAGRKPVETLPSKDPQKTNALAAKSYSHTGAA